MCKPLVGGWVSHRIARYRTLRLMDGLFARCVLGDREGNDCGVTDFDVRFKGIDRV